MFVWVHSIIWPFLCLIIVFLLLLFFLFFVFSYLNQCWILGAWCPCIHYIYVFMHLCIHSPRVTIFPWCIPNNNHTDIHNGANEKRASTVLCCTERQRVQSVCPRTSYFFFFCIMGIFICKDATIYTFEMVLKWNAIWNAMAI